MTTNAPSFDARQLRDVLGAFVTGVTVVTTRDQGGTAHGVTANSFSSVSLDPPLVLWSQSLTSRSYPAFRDSRHFAVNILADDQIALSNHFAKSRDDKFAGIPHRDGGGGAPVLDGVAAYLECEVVAAYPNGDHVVYIGRVERLGRSGRNALAFGGGKYLHAGAHELGPATLRLGTSRPACLESVRLAQAALPGIAAALGEHTLCLSVWGNAGPTAIAWEASRLPVSDQLRPGLVMSTTRSATGRAFAAFLPPEMTRALVDEDLRLFPEAQEDLAARRQRFEAEMEVVRNSGVAAYASDAPSPLHGVPVRAFSVPLRNGAGEMTMALSLTASAARLAAGDDAELRRALAEAGRALSARLA
ncbi:MAG: flavin reductase [Pseudomonadota bacterium]